MISSSPTLTIIRQTCCPKGTRGGIVWRRWSRPQSTMVYRGAIPSFDAYQPPATSIDLDLLEHFELPDAYLQNDLGEPSAASNYSLSLENTSRNVPSAVKSFLTSLRSQNFTQVIASFRDLHQHDFTRHLTSSDFSNILVAANPKHLFSRSSMAREITHGTVPDADPHLRLSRKFWANIRYILDNMARSGYNLTAMDYTGLMGKAVLTRNLEIQGTFWEEMRKAGVRPNTWTYNARLAAIAGVRPANALKKFPLIHADKYLNHWQSQDQNALTQAMEIYADMLKRGLFPNTMTIELLMMAHSRVGDVEGISKIVKNVYGITVDSEQPADSRPIITRGSPIYPTPKTMKVLAVSYCRNGHFAAALNVVDQLSTIYRLDIDDRTWEILLTYSYAFATPKYNMLAADTTKRLAEMRKERTTREPSLQARDIIIRSLARSNDPDTLEEAEQEIRRAVSYYRTQVQQKYMLQRDRWINSPPDRAMVWQREKAMNDSLYNVSMWKDAMGYWLYALLRSHWNLMEERNEPIAEFQTRQINLLEEFGVYWHKYRPLFEPPTKMGEKTVVKPRTIYRHKYPVAMSGLQGYPEA